jgi:hypothetical protein
VLDTASGQRRQLSAFNDALFAELELTPPERRLVHELRRPKIHALVQKPPRLDRPRSTR